MIIAIKFTYSKDADVILLILSESVRMSLHDPVFCNVKFVLQFSELMV